LHLQCVANAGPRKLAAANVSLKGRRVKNATARSKRAAKKAALAEQAATRAAPGAAGGQAANRQRRQRLRSQEEEAAASSGAEVEAGSSETAEPISSADVWGDSSDN
jgi:hypothetical protein